MNIHRRNYSEPIPGFKVCKECDNDFKNTQQHYDWQYQNQGICSWPCVINRSIEMEQYHKAKAREIIQLFFQTVGTNQLH